MSIDRLQARLAAIEQRLGIEPAGIVGDNGSDNKRIVQRFFETVVNQRNVAALDELVAADDGGGTCGGKLFERLVVDPDPTLAAVRGTDRIVPAAAFGREAAERSNIAAMRDFTQHVLQAFPDMRLTIESMVAEGDKVVVAWTATGTHRGEFLGTPPTGRTVPWSATDIFTVRNGKIADIQSQPNTAGVLDALGHLPATPLARAFGLRSGVG